MHQLKDLISELLTFLSLTKDMFVLLSLIVVCHFRLHPVTVMYAGSTSSNSRLISAGIWPDKTAYVEATLTETRQPSTFSSKLFESYNLNSYVTSSILSVRMQRKYAAVIRFEGCLMSFVRRMGPGIL